MHDKPHIGPRERAYLASKAAPKKVKAAVSVPGLTPAVGATKDEITIKPESLSDDKLTDDQAEFRHA